MTSNEGIFLVVDPFNSGSIYPRILNDRNQKYVAVYSSRCRAFVNEEEVVESNGETQTFFEWKYPSLERLVRDISEVASIRYVATGHDAGIALGDELRLQLCPEKANKVESSGARWSKSEFTGALEASGVDHLMSFSIDYDEAYEEKLSEELFCGRTFVLKPEASGGGDHVHHVRTCEEARSRARQMFSQEDLYGSRLRKIVVQEFFEGVEYVVDTVSRGGVHRVSNVLTYGKHKSKANEFIYDYVRWVEPSDPSVERLSEYAYRVLNAVGLEFGVAHIELLERDGRVVLVELGARPCGAASR